MWQKWQNKFLLKLEISKLVLNPIREDVIGFNREKSFSKPILIVEIAKKRLLPQMTKKNERYF